MTPRPRLTSLGMSAVLLVSVVASACGADPEAASSQANVAVERGVEVYAQSCASCHGSDLRGTDKGPSHLSIVYEPNHHGDESFRNAIASGAPQHHWGFGEMPAVEGLSTEDVDAVISFVRSEQQRQGFEQ